MGIEQRTAIVALANLISSLVMTMRDKGVLTDSESMAAIQNALEKAAPDDAEAVRELYDAMFSGSD